MKKSGESRQPESYWLALLFNVIYLPPHTMQANIYCSLLWRLSHSWLGELSL